jgi:hypothetical protein
MKSLKVILPTWLSYTYSIPPSLKINKRPRGDARAPPLGLYERKIWDNLFQIRIKNKEYDNNTQVLPFLRKRRFFHMPAVFHFLMKVTI